MMTVTEFVTVILELKSEHDFSVTSWIRSLNRNKEVGGGDKSFHLVGLGLDVVLDSPVDKMAFIVRARRLGLDAVDEGDHIHLEPAG